MVNFVEFLRISLLGDNLLNYFSCTASGQLLFTMVHGVITRYL